jgi:hypothetical protein
VSKQRKPKLPSKTSLAKWAKAAILDPRTPGPFRVIAEAGNPGYYMDRAVECIRQAQANPNVLPLELRQAVSLLLLTMEVKHGQNTEDRPSGSGDTGTN